MKTLVRVIESINEWSGKILSWICLSVILILVYQVVMRYVFRLPTIWTYDTVCLLGGSAACLAWGHVHLHDGHVRVDVIYNMLSPKRRAIVNFACGLVLFVPMFILLIQAAAERLWTSYVMKETLWSSSYFQPLDWPFRLVVLIAMSLFLLQVVAQLIRDFYFLTRNKTL